MNKKAKCISILGTGSDQVLMLGKVLSLLLYAVY